MNCGSGVIDTPSPNHEPRPVGATIDMLVLHYTGMKSAHDALDRLTDPTGDNRVSAHYMIDEAGRVHRLVAEARRAWHAGFAYWRGWRDINDRSIGIELVNPGHEFGYTMFPKVQMEALVGLAADIVSRHAIPGRNVVGHSDIAPDRKLDPGELFDWRRLALAGVGQWPEPVVTNPAVVPDLLVRYGYNPDAASSLSAFQRRFCPMQIDGVAGVETAAMLGGLMGLINAAD
jgi:N-acetylmuramoyl-L-alanine amidase